jgi:PPE-repeat protein
MKKFTKIITLAMTLTMAATGIALATPSTQIWIPSTDVRDFKQIHLDVDNYIRTSTSKGTNAYDLGLGVGVLPFEKLKLEIGADYLVYGAGSTVDAYPLSFNAKLGTPEGSLFKGSPALAVGGFGIGTKKNLTNANVVYGLAAETLPVVGRISAGYFNGNKDVLGKDNDGVLLSVDRTISEISDKLWAAVDYQGGDSSLGALSFGVAWAFTPSVSLIVGYDIFNAAGSANTFTTQLDINF